LLPSRIPITNIKELKNLNSKSFRRGWIVGGVSAIKRNICVNFEHQVHFTDGVFEGGNPLLRELLAGSARGRRRWWWWTKASRWRSRG
jgi:hypothetical protein